MAKTMGIYCKAYIAKDLREFTQWTEKSEAARIDEESGEPRVLEDDSVLYLQENYVVTDGIYQDENVIFDGVDDAWIQFCSDELDFAVPEDVLRANKQVA